MVDRAEAVTRVRAAVDARDAGADILIIARTDARATHGFEEALARVREFEAAGADILFLEAPESVDEMRQFCSSVKRPALCNMLEQGKTPILPPSELERLGFKIAAYPLTLLNAAIAGMQRALIAIAQGAPADGLLGFEELRRVVGFEEYYAEEQRYASPK